MLTFFSYIYKLLMLLLFLSTALLLPLSCLQSAAAAVIIVVLSCACKGSCFIVTYSHSAAADSGWSSRSSQASAGGVGVAESWRVFRAFLGSPPARDEKHLSIEY